MFTHPRQNDKLNRQYEKQSDWPMSNSGLKSADDDSINSINI